ncbi:MAG TPA: dihydrolipoyllysine-residue succinyltransferase, partial [Acidimicrobiaceae bacterium]|nr:dihydrolipoyllysine-residue succinyltransferase [Acidimicrobiaceae bacterium]
MADVFLPQLGETITEGTITRWFVGVGDSVAVDQPLYEVSTDKVDSEVPSPLAGVLAEIVAGEGALVAVGALLCRVDPAGSTAAAPGTVSDVATGPAAASSPMTSTEPVSS